MHHGGVHVALVYFDIDTGHETVLSQWHGAPELQAHLQTLCERQVHWARQEAAQ